MNWYQEELIQKNVRQVVFEAGAGQAMSPKFGQLLLTAKFLPLLTNTWATGFFYLDSDPGPFLMVRADKIAGSLRDSPITVAFSFYRMKAGGLIVMYVHADCPAVAQTLKHPIVLFEIAYGLDDENIEMKRIIERAINGACLHLCFTEGDGPAEVSPDFVSSTGMRSQFDVQIPLSPDCKIALQKEYNDILTYHAGVSASKRDYMESVKQLWAENLEGVNPILPCKTSRHSLQVTAPAPVVAGSPAVPAATVNLQQAPSVVQSNMTKGKNGMYLAPIDRNHPSCFLFLIDQSGSMDEKFGAVEMTKADAVADAINRLLQDLTLKCTKGDGVRNYYDIGVIGYGERVGPAFGGTLAGRSLVPISDVEEQPAKVEPRTKKVPDGAGGLVDMPYELPIWFFPVANGGTPMCAAFDLARQTLEVWTANHPDSYPPIVINITDGEATDGDPTAAAQSVASLATRDGNVLVFNCHISSNSASPKVFTSDEAGLPDELAIRLLRMSSPLPEKLRQMARANEYRIADTARGFAFNANLVDLIRFLDIGTRPANLLR